MYLVGRVLTQQEIHAAFGLSRSGYRKAQDETRLITADNLLRVANHFNINYIELMSRFGLIKTEAVEEFLKKAGDFRGGPAGDAPPPLGGAAQGDVVLAGYTQT